MITKGSRLMQPVKDKNRTTFFKVYDPRFEDLQGWYSPRELASNLLDQITRRGLTMDKTGDSISVKHQGLEIGYIELKS